MFYLYESWCGSSGGRNGRTFADKFYTGMVSHLNGQRRSSRGPNHVGAQQGPQGLLPGSLRSWAFPAIPAVWLALRFPQHPRPSRSHLNTAQQSLKTCCLGNNYCLTTRVHLLREVSAVSETEKVNHTLQMGLCSPPTHVLY